MGGALLPPPADLAVSPQDPDSLLATTESGLARSLDGGRPFSPVDDAPLLHLLGWAQGGTLAALDPSGTVHVSSDGGASCEVRGSVGGQVSAFAVEPGALFAALEDRVVVSRDDGRTFEEHSLPG